MWLPGVLMLRSMGKLSQQFQHLGLHPHSAVPSSCHRRLMPKSLDRLNLRPRPLRSSVGRTPLERENTFGELAFTCDLSKHP